MKYLFSVLLLLFVTIAPAAPVSTGDADTTATSPAYSEIGYSFPFTLPGTGEPNPGAPFRPVLVPGSIAATTSSVSVSFTQGAGDPNPPQTIAVAVVPSGTVFTDTQDLIALATVVAFDAGGRITIVIPVQEQQQDRESQIVFVGIRN